MQYKENYKKLITDNDELYERLHTNAVITAYRGSIAHGLHIPPEEEFGTDDVDVISICVLPRDYYFAINRNLQPKDTIEYKESEFDIVSYELTKFASMLTKANPNVLSLLWTRPEEHIYTSPDWKFLHSWRHEFLSKFHVYNSFSQYAGNQINRLQYLRSDAAYMGEKRRNIVNEFGYDTKNAAHAIRLLKMGIELLDTGEMEVYRTTDRQELIAIKQGYYSLDEIKEHASDLQEVARQSYVKSALPDKVDIAPIQSLISEIVIDIIYNDKGD